MINPSIQYLFRRSSKKVYDLWWLGIPPSVRGSVWKLAFGNDLHITQGKCIHWRTYLLPVFNTGLPLCYPGDLALISQTMNIVFFLAVELFEIFRCHAEQKLVNNENTRSNLRKGEDSQNKSQNFVTDSIVDLITMDVSRTFPSLGIFQKVL